MNLHIQIVITASKKLFNIIQDSPKQNTKDLIKTNLENATIEFNSVSLSLDSRKQILNDLNLKFDQNIIYAITGTLGSGKSSIMNLLLGFYEKNTGEIRINNHLYKNLDIKYLRSQIDFISQDNMLMNDTIINNITYGANKLTMNKILEVAKNTYLQDVVQNLQGEYEFVIEHKGYNLSGGQRQLIALTRSLIRNAPILILDEATSALDFKLERKIWNYIKEIRKDKMTLVITHRIKNLINISKNIFIIKNGRCIGYGNHDNLYASNEEYKDLYNSE